MGSSTSSDETLVMDEQQLLAMYAQMSELEKMLLSQETYVTNVAVEIETEPPKKRQKKSEMVNETPDLLIDYVIKDDIDLSTPKRTKSSNHLASPAIGSSHLHAKKAALASPRPTPARRRSERNH